MAHEETADGEMKEDDESVKGKAEKEKAKATDVRLKALEKVSETMKTFRQKWSGKSTEKRTKKWQRDHVDRVQKSGKRPDT